MNRPELPLPAPDATIVLDPARCTGCRLCELACVEEHFGPVPEHDVEHPLVYDRRRLAIRPATSGGPWRIEVCDHCEPHPCVGVCPHHALIPWRNGAVTLLTPRCTGCGACITACDRHAIRRVSALSVAIKCDGCHDRPGPPACVRACPDDALGLAPLAQGH